MPATLLQFAQVNDSAAATPKKLIKQAVLAEYFRLLGDDADLRRAVRYAGGRPFTSTDERTLNVGGAIVSDVVLAILKLDPRAYHELVVRSGEIGEALSKVWPPSNPQREPLTLRDLAETFDDLAVSGNVQRKKSLLHELFMRCSNGREAAYLAKIIFGDLRTGVQEGVLQAAIAMAFNRPLAAVQRCQLLVGDLDEVAALAKHDALATAQFRLFHPIQFMLATPQETVAIAAETLAGRTFYAEDKLDGIRAQVHKQGDRIAIYTRTMDRTDASFPDVVESMAKLSGDFLLDGEIVPYRNGAVLPFAHIQKRLGRKSLTAKILRENPATFIAFDILYRNGEMLMDRPLRERRSALDGLFAGAGSPRPDVDAQAAQGGETPPLHSVDVAAAVVDQPRAGEGGETPPLRTVTTDVRSAIDIEAAFNKSRESRNEGLVLKDPDSLYSPGRRGKMWLKVKTYLPTFDCVVTAAEYGHGKRKNSLSDYTFAVWDRDPNEDGATLVNVGKAYSGVTDEEIARLTEVFLQLSQRQWGRVHFVEPKVVLEIACDQIQKSQRHDSGYALRFPRIKRVRWDKGPAEADRLARIVEIFESTHNFGRTASSGGTDAPEPTLFDGM